MPADHGVVGGFHRCGAGACVQAISLHPVGRVVGLFLAVGRVVGLWFVVLLSQKRVWLWLLGIRAWR